ncbi:MAG TPA: [FeFe] hydrogenase H-cluster maturation GTPase HydF [Candidatus Anaerotruncus excrementipullorum]|uniref:[FeFe] hydrogenase H-cluster maturation GTPase HydF n=1 Tax=Candidatus Anaerotruncus excrementipullorum TaxID=2838465 RepID=A0A9D1WR65_9FIRM|nr:[FeFe] hydrogenase H-cluster maturation GTPase HydF [Candidatus Anaerotruncus excrementipullorum]
MSLQSTPSANRLHIGIFGKRNSGKSSLINAITNQSTALVSEVAGTTTDPVYKAMEIRGLGPCMLIDTAGFDDVGRLGELRMQKTREALEKTDIAVLVCASEPLELERRWVELFRERDLPILAVINKADLLGDAGRLALHIRQQLGLEPLLASAKERTGIQELIAALVKNRPEGFGEQTLTGDLARDGDVVLLVMPQDIQAPQGRLILPQVQTIRELLDKRCTVVGTTADRLDRALAALAAPPRLIITDSQVFPQVCAQKPPESLLTSFSVLMAGLKGDLQVFAQGAQAIDTLTGSSRVLIAEACTHAPQEEDIGRVKIPRLLRQRAGEGLSVQVVCGPDFPEDLSGYDLIIHCGACMFNRRYVLSRIHRAQAQGVPITNYGIAIAKLTGILDQIAL